MMYEYHPSIRECLELLMNARSKEEYDELMEKLHRLKKDHPVERCDLFD